MKLKVNDTVMVIAGKDKGKSGKIMKIDRKNSRVTVEKINMLTKHVKKTYNRPGEKITYEGSLSVSNVMAIDPKSGKPTRLSYKKLANGKKERVTQKSQVSFDNISTSTATPKTSKKKAK